MHPNIMKMQQNMSFGSLGVYRVRSYGKIPTRLRDTNFSVNCTRLPICTEFSAVTKQSQMHSNNTKCNKTCFLCPMVCIGCIRSEKIRREFVARSFALIASDWPVCIEFNAVTKWSQMHQTLRNATKLCLGSHGVFLVRS